MKWYEDFEPGEVVELGSHHFSAEEIVAFASLYDPQPFHLSEEAGKRSLFGRLAASGWHTAAIFMRLNVAGIEREIAARRARGEATPASGPSPGFQNMRWPKPVFAGDTLTYRSVLTGKRVTATRPGWGIVQYRNEAFNQDGEKVFEFDSNVFVPRRDAEAAAEPEAAAG